jgi:hypothetical protein
LILAELSPGDGVIAFLYDHASGKVDPTPAMPVPKSGSWVGSAAIRLDDGTVLISGGKSDSELNAETILFNPDSNAWIKIPTGDMTFPRSGHAAALTPSGNVLVMGGNVKGPYDGNWNDTAEIFDTQTMTWAPTTPMLNQRFRHTATALSNGLIVVVGGSASSTAEFFDPASQLWTSLESSNDARYFDHTATLLDSGRVFVAGGLSGLRSTSVATNNAFVLVWEELTAPKDDPFQNSGFHSATKIDDHALLVVGGVPLDDDTHLFTAPLAAAYVYDEAADELETAWTQIASPSNAYALHTATTLEDGRVLVAGGMVGTTAEIFDPSNGSWHSVAPMPTGIMRATATLLKATKKKGQRVLHVGGVYTSGDNLTAHDVLLYDPKLDTWTSAAEPVLSDLSSRFGHTATLLEDDDDEDDKPPKVLVVGGAELAGTGGMSNNELSKLSRDAALFDPDTDTWTTVAPMNVARAFHTATLLADGRVLVAGGGEPFHLVSGGNIAWNAVYVSAEIYDPKTDTWTLAGNMNDPRTEHQAVLLASKRVLVAGGRRNSGGRILGSAEIFDPLELTWTTTSSLQAPRYGHSLTLLEKGAVAVGGFQPFSAIDSQPERYPQAKQGSPCVLDDQCSSKYCVDGVCCDEACNSPCKACAAAAAKDPKLKTKDDGTCEDVSGCSPFACDSDTGECGTTCSEIKGCASGHVCDPDGDCVNPLKNASVLNEASCAATPPAQSNAPSWPGLVLAAGAFAWRRHRQTRKHQRKL